MKSKLENIRIDPDNPFANCKLERAKFALPLREIVKSYSDGCATAGIAGTEGAGAGPVDLPAEEAEVSAQKGNGT